MRNKRKIMTTLLLIGLILLLTGCHYSCKSYCAKEGLGPVPPELAKKMHWSDECEAWIDLQRTKIAQAQIPKPAPTPAPKPTRTVTPEQGPNEVTRTLPCNDCGILKIEKIMPQQANINAPFDYKIVATNLTDMPLSNVTIMEALSDGFVYQKSEPNAKKDGRVLTWDIPGMGPGESKTFLVSGYADKTGQIVNCANASYVIPACARTDIVEAQLVVAHTIQEAVLICDEIPVRIIVRNNGSGTASNVKVVAALPEGLTTVEGQKTININVGALGAGQAKEYTVKTKAAKVGRYPLKATAMADGDLKAESVASTTVVTQPVLQIVKEGPKTLYLGRRAEYTITVKNTGTATAQKTVVEDTIPDGVEDVRVTDGGKMIGSKLRWELGELPQNASKTLLVTYMPTRAATLSNTASATATCAAAVSASAQTSVKGIAAILLEVIDVEDPIEVGTNETYQITVTNQGTAVDTNIVIKGILEGQFMEYVSSKGATRGTLSDGVVTFAPLPSLAPKAKATWEITIKALKEGDVRFRIVMNSDQLDRDVEETEATNFYQ
ncbi:MAG: DUF11 domain-containing protein [Sedimentisphaerales bacterium]|nr:DUF11 domain-containing protein [Sedimentisphaerales bacterium]